MNRKIKFRGKVIDSSSWVYGDLRQNEDKAYIEQYGIIYAVNPNSVGQFTGITDSNGKEIYEGDILKLDFDTRTCIEVVEFREGRFVSFDPEKPYKADALYLWIRFATVIGNINDNPELLKGGEDGRNS